MNLYQVCISIAIGSLFLLASQGIPMGNSHMGIQENKCDLWHQDNIRDASTGTMVQNIPSLAEVSHRVENNKETETWNHHLMISTPVNDTSIAIMPFLSTVGITEEFLVNISVHPSQAISGIQFDLSFNPDLLEAIDIVEGGLFRSSQTYFNPGIIDNTHGVISNIYGGAILGNTTLPGIFAQITFTSRQEGGISPLIFSNVVIGTPRGIPLPLIINHGTVAIEAPNQPPSVSFTHPSDGAYLSGGFLITGSANDSDGDIHRVEIRVNQGIWQNATGTNQWTYFWDTVPLEDGEHNLSARSFDGTVYSRETTIHVHVDNTPPFTVFLINETQGNQGWYTSNITITLQAIDNASTVQFTKYHINTEPFQLYNGTFPVTSEGTTQITYYSMDEANNREREKTVFINLDKTKPDTSIYLSPSSPQGNNGWYVSPVTINLQATDNVSGVQNITYKIDEEEWRTHQGNDTTLTITSNGSHLLTYYACDNAGNIEDVQILPFKIDAHKPLITSTTPKDNMLYILDREFICIPGHTVIIGKITVTATAIDSVSGIERIQVLIDKIVRYDDSHHSITYIYDDRSLLPRRHTLQIQTMDFAGNTQRTDMLTFWIFNV